MPGMLVGDVVDSTRSARSRRWHSLRAHLSALKLKHGSRAFRVLTTDQHLHYGDQLLQNQQFIQVSPDNVLGSWECGGALTLKYWCSPYETVWSGAISPCGTWMLYGGSIVMLVNLFSGSSQLLLSLGLVPPGEPRGKTQLEARNLPVCGCCAFSADSAWAVASQGYSLALCRVSSRTMTGTLSTGSAAPLVACALARAASHAAACDASGTAFCWSLPSQSTERLFVAAVRLAVPGARCCTALELSDCGCFAFGGSGGLELWQMGVGASDTPPFSRRPVTFADAGCVLSVNAAPTTATLSASSSTSCAVLVTTSETSGCTFWNSDGQCLGVIGVSGGCGVPRGAWLGAGGRRALILSGSSTLRLFEVAPDGTPLQPPVQLLFGGRHMLSFCALSPEADWAMALGLTPIQAVELIAQRIHDTGRNWPAVDVV